MPSLEMPVGDEQEAGENVNCLEGMKCPKCGQREPFDIKGAAVMVVYDDGVGNPADDCSFDWGDDSYCGCDCGFSGTVRDFREGGKDD